eukprot:316889_1
MTTRKTASTRDISKKDVVDPKRKLEAKMWIQTVLDITLNNDLFDELQDGTLLCEVLNKIQPGTCKKYKKSKHAFVSRNNIGIFIKGARQLGLPATDVFETRDLYDKQRLSAVVQTVYSVSAISRKLGFSGPFIGVSYSEANKRHFTKAQLARTKSTVPLLSRGDKLMSSKHSSHDSYGIVKTSKDMQNPSAVPSTSSKGSKQMDTTGMDGYGIIKTNKEMQGHTGVLSVWQQGAKNIENKSMDKYGIVKTDKSMQKPSQVPTLWAQGSLKTDIASKHDSYGIIKTKDHGSSTGVLSAWEKGSKPIENTNMDGYGIVKTDKSMQNPSQVQSVW